jgi:hypothetical protein
MLLRVFQRIFGESVGGEQRIGFDGEIKSAKLRINVANEKFRYPNATYAILVKRADNATYPAAIDLTPCAKGWLEYVFSPSDLSVAGNLFVEVQLRVASAEPEILDSDCCCAEDDKSDIIIKSTIWLFTVAKSLSCTTQNPPPPIPSWADDVVSKAQEAIDAIQEWQDGGGAGDGGGNTCGCTEMTEEEFQEIYDTIFNN